MKRCNLVVYCYLGRRWLVSGLMVALLSTSCEQQRNGYALRQPSYVGTYPFAGNGSSRRVPERLPGGSSNTLASRGTSPLAGAGHPQSSDDPRRLDQGSDMYGRTDAAKKSGDTSVTETYPFYTSEAVKREEDAMYLKFPGECGNQHPNYKKLNTEMEQIKKQLARLTDENKRSELEVTYNQKWEERQFFADDDKDCLANMHANPDYIDPDSCVPAGAIAVQIAAPKGFDIKDRITLDRDEDGEEMADSFHRLYVDAAIKDKDAKGNDDKQDVERLVRVPSALFTKTFGEKGTAEKAQSTDPEKGLKDKIVLKDSTEPIEVSLEKKIRLFRGGTDNIGWPSEWGADSQKADDETAFITTMVYAAGSEEAIFTAIGPGKDLGVKDGMAFILGDVTRVNSVGDTSLADYIPLGELFKAWRNRHDTVQSTARGFPEGQQVGVTIFWSKAGVGKGGLWVKLDADSKTEGFRPIPPTKISALPNLTNQDSPFYVKQSDWQAQAIIFKELTETSPIYQAIADCEDRKKKHLNGEDLKVEQDHAGDQTPIATEAPAQPPVVAAPPADTGGQVQTPPSDNDRITALEKAVAELKREVEELKKTVATAEADKKPADEVQRLKEQLEAAKAGLAATEAELAKANAKQVDDDNTRDLDAELTLLQNKYDDYLRVWLQKDEEIQDAITPDNWVKLKTTIINSRNYIRYLRALSDSIVRVAGKGIWQEDKSSLAHDNIVLRELIPQDRLKNLETIRQALSQAVGGLIDLLPTKMQITEAYGIDGLVAKYSKDVDKGMALEPAAVPTLMNGELAGLTRRAENHLKDFQTTILTNRDALISARIENTEINAAAVSAGDTKCHIDIAISLWQEIRHLDQMITSVAAETEKQIMAGTFDFKLVENLEQASEPQKLKSRKEAIKKVLKPSIAALEKKLANLVTVPLRAHERPLDDIFRVVGLKIIETQRTEIDTSEIKPMDGSGI